MKNLSEYIFESTLSEVCIDAIKEFVMKQYKASTWEECIDKQKFGDCDKLCRKICKAFPKMFNYMYDLDINYSPIAVKKLNDIGDNGEMYGNHYVLVHDGTLYDFGKGTNSINGIYLMTQDNDMKDKYTIKLSSREQYFIKSKIKRLNQ